MNVNTKGNACNASVLTGGSGRIDREESVVRIERAVRSQRVETSLEARGHVSTRFAQRVQDAHENLARASAFFGLRPKTSLAGDNQRPQFPFGAIIVRGADRLVPLQAVFVFHPALVALVNLVFDGLAGGGLQAGLEVLELG